MKAYLCRKKQNEGIKELTATPHMYPVKGIVADAKDHDATMFSTSKEYKGYLKLPNKCVANVNGAVEITTRTKIEDGTSCRTKTEDNTYMHMVTVHPVVDLADNSSRKKERDPTNSCNIFQFQTVVMWSQSQSIERKQIHNVCHEQEKIRVIWVQHNREILMTITRPFYIMQHLLKWLNF